MLSVIVNSFIIVFLLIIYILSEWSRSESVSGVGNGENEEWDGMGNKIVVEIVNTERCR